MGVVKVYGVAASPYVATVLVCLEEAGAAYELVPVDMAAREQKSQHHLARNPFGKIPAFEDEEVTLFESRAIQRYVLRKYNRTDLLREGNLEESAMVDVWREVEAHHYEPAISHIVRECVIKPMIGGGTRDQAIVDENVEKLKKVLEVYEKRLSDSVYLAGDFISVADLNHFPYTYFLMTTEYATLVESCTNVKAWWERLLVRPSVRKVAAMLAPLVT
uniref:glutathione transferase n=1 Tax=Leersia perrieri TaxID=77586 RepID=A0A0D9WCU2_9ORYZ